jgi:hypothetical protein
MHGHDAKVAIQIIGEHCDWSDILFIICIALFLFIFNVQGSAKSLDNESNVVIEI